ncbi:hypothetical protein ABH894_005527, partial [Paenibacillus sp. RC62]
HNLSYALILATFGANSGLKLAFIYTNTDGITL